MKMKSLNALLVDRFAYIARAEYLANCAQNCNEMGISAEKYCDNDIVVSLTTYGIRLFDVYLSIESIMQQTLKPNRLILWLGDDLKNVHIPLILQKQQKRGLEIRYCKDIGPYTKLIPALKAFPSSCIITVDDDHLYGFDLMENLVLAHKMKPGTVYCARMHRMKLLSPKSPEKYEKWTQHYDHSDISPLNFPTGVGGVLYPPNCFSKEVFNEEVFLDICKHADDIWFKAMALYNGVMAQKIPFSRKNYFTGDFAQKQSLFNLNVVKNMNDIQLKAVFDRYNLYEKLTIK